MKMNKYAFFALSIMIMLAMVQPVLGAEYDANLELSAQTAASCPVEDTMITATIKNLGTDTDRYTISSDSNWITIGNDIITLEAGRSKTFALWIKPAINAEQGQYTITLTATPDSDKDQKYEDSMDFIVMKCHGLEMTANTDKIDACIGETETVDIILSNTGKTEETFILTSTTGTFSTDRMTIASDTEKTATLSIPVAKNKEIVTINAQSTTSYATGTTEIEVVSEGACYSIAVLNIPPQITVCKGDTAKIVVTAKNTGYKTDTFTLSTDAENAYFNNEELELKSKEVKETYLEISTDESEIGDLDYSITIDSENAKDTAYGTITIETCYTAELIADKTETSVCPGASTGFEVEIKNTGKKEDTYTIAASKGSLSETEITLDAGTGETILLVIETEKTDTEDTNILLTLNSERTEDNKEFIVSMREFDDCYGLSVTSDSDSIFAEDLKGYLYTLTIKNDGEFEAGYTASIDGPKWTTINPDTMSLTPGDSTEVYVYASPEYDTAEGTYSITVSIESDQGTMIEKELTFAFKSEETVAPITGQITIADDTTEEIDDKDTDKEDKKFPTNIVTAIIVGIIIILLIIFGPELLKEDDEDKKEDKKEEKKADKTEKKSVAPTKKAEIKKEDKKKAETKPAKKIETKKDTKKKAEVKKAKAKPKKKAVREERKEDIKQILDNI
ncbi:MAG: hypothetical protein GQ477_00490 [Nanohaloarchaea archaeon]|nr:hypothetical protein [Candidatus Nanohaloarchaea archaeon]